MKVGTGNARYRFNAHLGRYEQSNELDHIFSHMLTVSVRMALYYLCVLQGTVTAQCTCFLSSLICMVMLARSAGSLMASMAFEATLWFWLPLDPFDPSK